MNTKYQGERCFGFIFFSSPRTRHENEEDMTLQEEGGNVTTCKALFDLARKENNKKDKGKKR